MTNASADESAALDGLVDRAAEAVESVLRDGVKVAMNQFNVRERAEEGEQPD